MANAPCASDSVSMFTSPCRTMRAWGETAGSPFCTRVTTSPRIEPGWAGASSEKPLARSATMDKTESENLRTAVLLLTAVRCNGKSKLRARRRRSIQAVEETMACKFQTQIIRDPKFEELQMRELGTCRRLGRLPAYFLTPMRRPDAENGIARLLFKRKGYRGPPRKWYGRVTASREQKRPPWWVVREAVPGRISWRYRRDQP